MTRTRVPLRRGRRGSTVVRLLVLAGALAGLFAMHGLGDHGASRHEVGGPVDTATMEISQASRTADVARNATDVEWAVDEAPGDSPGVAMAGLCLAVLAGAILGFQLLRPHRIVACLRPLALTFVASRSSVRRDRDPPCLFELSVLRT